MIENKCNLCPRQCNVNRDEKSGYCGMQSHLYVARAALHMWEEPCISGQNGSGAVFFTGCPLRCVFCQNYQIAKGRDGKEISVERLSEIFLELQDKKANNINLVTPTHYVPQIIEALDRARAHGLRLPIVYNTGSYEKVETLRMLEGYVDVYLPDLKYYSSEYAARYSNAPDYFEQASAAIAEMYRQVGKPQFYDAVEAKETGVEEGMMRKGVIVRHLLLPGLQEDSKAVLRYLYETYQDNVYVSIMNQYTPLKQVEKYPEINRKITAQEYDSVVDYAIDLGVENGFIQEEGTVSESFIPEFNYEGV